MCGRYWGEVWGGDWWEGMPKVESGSGSGSKVIPHMEVTCLLHPLLALLLQLTSDQGLTHGGRPLLIAERVHNRPRLGGLLSSCLRQRAYHCLPDGGGVEGTDHTVPPVALLLALLLAREKELLAPNFISRNLRLSGSGVGRLGWGRVVRVGQGG